MRFRRISVVSSWLRRQRQQRPKARIDRRMRLIAQVLEDRAVPATVVWDGGAGTLEFNDAANWDWDIVPGPGDDVVIPALPGNKAVIARGIVSLGSLKSDAPIVLRTGVSKYVFPGQTLQGSLLVTAGQSRLSKGLYVDTSVQNTFWFYARGATTTLTIDGPVQKVNGLPGSSPTSLLGNTEYFEMKAIEGAKITLTSPALQKFSDVEIAALDPGSRIEIAGQAKIETDGRFGLYASGGGTIAMPDLTNVTLNASAERFAISSLYADYPRFYNRLTNQVYSSGGSFSFPKLTTIDDRQDGRTRKTTVTMTEAASVLDTPELRTLTNASVSISDANWIAPKLNSFTRGNFYWSVPSKTIRFGALSDIAETSINVNRGFVELVISNAIDLATMRWDTTWKSDGALSSLTVTTPQMRGQLGQGNFFRIEAVNGGLVTLNSATLIDDADSKTDGGLFLKADTDGVLRMNVKNTRGANLDLFEKGVAAFDQVIDARFKSLRGWAGKSGKLYGSQMKSLTVDTYASASFETGGKYFSSNPYDIKSLVTPKLESVASDAVNQDGWNAPVFPAFRTVTWDGGAGTNRWSDAANWSDDRIPGPNTTVTIPAIAGLTEILIDSNVEIRSIVSQEPLRLATIAQGSPITLKVTSGASQLLAGATMKGATLATFGSGTTLDVYGTTKVEGSVPNGSTNPFAATKPAKIGFSASNGSWLFVHDTAKFDSGLIELEIASKGGGSRVVFPSLVTAAFETPRADASRSIVRLKAENRAEIDLPQLKTLSADRIEVTIDNSWISSPKLTTISRAMIRIADPSDDGIRNADWITGDLVSVTGSILKFEGADVVESFDNVKTIDETEIHVDRSKVYFPAVDKIDLSKFFYQGSALQDLDESKRGFYFMTGYYVSGSSGLLEIRANEMSGAIPDYYRFEISGASDYAHPNGGLISLLIPVMKLPQAKTDVSGQMILSATDGGTIRADTTTAEGMTIALYPGGAVAFDKVNHGKFRQISRPNGSTGGTFYASNMELMTISEPDWHINTNLNIIVAPKLRMINGNFETVANPFPLLESITGSILLKHEPGTPVSQITVFDTPKIGRITNLTVTMEQGVRWPQLDAQADWSGVSVFRINADGSKSAVVRTGVKSVQASATATQPAVAPTVSSSVAPKAASAPTAAKSAKSKIAPKPVPKPPQKPAVAKKPVTKPAPKPQLARKR